MRNSHPSNAPEGAPRASGDLETVHIEKWVFGGHGLSRVEGRVVLAPFVLPGETAEVRSKDSLHANLVRIVEPSPHRVAPPCPYFGVCGGCHYQHAPYEYQLEQKVGILREVMRRVGKFDAPEHIDVLRGPEWEYRNRVQLHIRDGKIGYLQAGSHDLCAIEKCPISSPKINETIRILNRLIRDARFPNFIQSLELFTNETEIQVNVLESSKPVARRFFDWLSEEIPGFQDGSLGYSVYGRSFTVGPRSFFQVNRFLIGALTETALGGFSGKEAWDLYAGVGLFSLPLSERFPEVVAVESGRNASTDLHENLSASEASITLAHTNVDEFLSEAQSAPDFVLADPPRAGLGKSVVRELIRLKPQRLHIVACDPATLARDLSGLLTAGYRIEAMTLVDLFPQTFHMETVVRLTAS